MINIIIAFSRPQDAKSIKGLLVRSGFHVSAVCVTGAQALSAADQLGSGIIVCGYRFPDMLYDELYEGTKLYFDMLLLASAGVVEYGVPDGVLAVTMPLKANDLVNTLDMLAAQIERRRKKKRQQPQPRKTEEKKMIEEAKGLLMERNHMSEEEAHRYIQKTSMDSGTNMIETAQMVITLLRST